MDVFGNIKGVGENSQRSMENRDWLVAEKLRTPPRSPSAIDEFPKIRKLKAAPQTAGGAGWCKAFKLSTALLTLLPARRASAAETCSPHQSLYVEPLRHICNLHALVGRFVFPFRFGPT